MSDLQTVRRGGSVFERHNGVGLKERFAQASNATYIGPDAEVLGNAETFGSPHLEGRTIIGTGCRVSGEVHMDDSRLSKGASASDNAQVIRSRATGNVLIADSAVVVDCQIQCEGDARVRITEKARLRNVKINGECFIEGQSEVEDCTLVPGTRIYGGIWRNKGPRVVRTRHAFDLVQSAIPGNLIISCQDRPIDLWIREGKKLGKEYGLTDAEMAEYTRLVKEWKTYEERKNGR